MAIKPTSKMTYALRALVDLALHQDLGLIPVKAIAQRQEIPVQCLEQVLHRLGRQGILQTGRGPRGGYQLKRQPQEILISEVFESLEEPVRKKTKNQKSEKPDPAQVLWQQVQMAVAQTLEATTLQHLVEQAKDAYENPMAHPYVFHI